MSFETLFGNLLLFTALLIPGYLLGKLGKISHGAMESITNLLTDIAMPFLVFAKLLETDFSSVGVTDILVCILFPIGIELILLPVTALFFRKKEDGKYAVSRCCAIFSNCGFLGIPLAASLFPDEPRAVLFVSVFNVFSTLMLLTLGIFILSGDKKHIDLCRAVLKPITLAIVLGVLLSVTGLAARLPALSTYSNYLAQLTTPLAMIVLGFELSGLRLRSMFTTVSLYTVSLVKLVISPVLSLLLLLSLKVIFKPEISSCLAAAMLISTGVSTAASTPAMAEKYGGDSRYAATLTLGTTILCMVTLPLLSLLFEKVF